MLKWFELKRWENYLLLALLSVGMLVIASAHSFATHARSSLSILSDTPVRAISRMNETIWKKRHLQIIRNAEQQPADVVFLGDSITQGFENNIVWHENYNRMRVLNAGIASDRVEHILWRTQNGLFDKITPKVVVLLAGVNNLALASPEKIAAGHVAIINEIQRRSPSTKVLVLAVFPSGEMANHPRRLKIRKLNNILASIADGRQIHYMDFGRNFLDNQGRLSKRIMFDYLHLTTRGYDIWADSMNRKLLVMLKNS